MLSHVKIEGLHVTKLYLLRDEPNLAEDLDRHRLVIDLPGVM